MKGISLFRNKKKEEVFPEGTFLLDEEKGTSLYIKPIQEEEVSSLSLVEVKEEETLEEIKRLFPSLLEASKTNGVAYQILLPLDTYLPIAKEEKKKTFSVFLSGLKKKSGSTKNLSSIVPVGITPAAFTNGVFLLASALVGKYYLSQISRRLHSIDEKLDKIISFQESEYYGRLLSLVSLMKTERFFEEEILSSPSALADERQKLASAEKETCDLLGQALVSMEKISKEEDLRYQDFEQKSKDAQYWLENSRILLSLLYEISERDYLFFGEEKSKDLCQSLLRQYLARAEKTYSELADFQKRYQEKYRIDLEKKTRKRPLGIETSLDADFVSYLADQENKKEITIDSLSPFSKTVSLIIKDEDVYLQEESSRHY